MTTLRSLVTVKLLRSLLPVNSYPSENSEFRSRGYSGLLAFLLLLLTILPDRAALASGNSLDLLDMSLEELAQVTVVARRREEPLHDVPFSMTVISADEIELSNMTSTSHLADLAPNVRFDTTAVPNTSRIYIRGLGQRSQGFRSDPRVGVYRNGVHVPRAIGGIFDLLDIESVELLRGPQGTLFGKNTVGGAILIQSTPPEPTVLNGRLRAGLGSDGLRTLAATGNLPIIEDSLALRLSFNGRRYDGYQHNLTRNLDVFDENTRTVYIDLLATPSDDQEFRISFEYFDLDENGSGTNCIWKPAPGSVAGLAAVFNPTLYDRWRDECAVSGSVGPDAVTSNPFGGRETLTIQGVNAAWERQGRSLMFKSLTAYRGTEATAGLFDFDGIPSELFSVDQTVAEEGRVLSQEFQLGSEHELFNWISGLYYSDERGTFDGLEACAAVGLVLPDFDGDGASDFEGSCNPTFGTTDRIKSWALYGEATIYLSPRWNLSLGLRYTSDRKSATDGPVGELISREARFSAFTPRISLSYRHSEDTMFYGGLSRGYTSGGFNGFTTGLQPYDEEFVDTIETGVRSGLPGGWARLHASLFHSRLNDQQVLVEGVAENGTFTALYNNAASSAISGGEFELMLQPTERLTMSLGVGFINAGYDEFRELIQAGVDGDGNPLFESRDRSGLKFDHTPERSLNSTLGYLLPLDGVGSLNLKLDWNYESESFGDPANTPEAAVRARHLINATAALNLANGNTRLSLWARNLTDEVYTREGSHLAAFDLVFVQYAPRRIVGVELTHYLGEH